MCVVVKPASFTTVSTILQGRWREKMAPGSGAEDCGPDFEKNLDAAGQNNQSGLTGSQLNDS
jgi:hypothetical protein